MVLTKVLSLSEWKRLWREMKEKGLSVEILPNHESGSYGIYVGGKVVEEYCREEECVSRLLDIRLCCEW